jgi:hypothetical protein
MLTIEPNQLKAPDGGEVIATPVGVIAAALQRKADGSYVLGLALNQRIAPNQVSPYIEVDADQVNAALEPIIAAALRAQRLTVTSEAAVRP